MVFIVIRRNVEGWKWQFSCLCFIEEKPSAGLHSMFCQCFMSIDAEKPSAVLHIDKTLFYSKEQLESISFENKAQQMKIEDSITGITAKTVIKSLIPDSKHSLKKIISVSLTGGLPPLQMRRINSSATIKATCCLKPFKQRPKLLKKIRYSPPAQPGSYFCKEINAEISAELLHTLHRASKSNKTPIEF